ncbi:G protein pathway suppressor 2 [Leptopilina boulardi]|uniref:G protein pathway suppressor 2 n=1 Tax=Leptopilina boulardi TaxID=63433 RepID=UPI0021F66781|nr:G protein pathway suppressor 2 [Leptopilina boulardi]
MPAVIVGNPQRTEQMAEALKVHILRERQRKKQEQEADAEEERQRKERERQQKQDVMTLGETREQITTLENELSQLKDEKHQLFLQLKKVLNEDDNRRRQLIKENNACSEIMPITGGYRDPGTGSGGVCRSLRDPVFPGQMVPSHPLYKILSTLPAQIPATMKRTRSPSPPPQAYGPFVYTAAPIPNYKNPLPKTEEAARRTGDSRAVLWNKNNQYPPSSFYSTPSGQGVFSYSAPTSQPSRESEAEYITLQSIMQDKFYPRPTSHVTVHGGAIPIQQPPQGAKTGGITSGYPVRAPQPPPSAYQPPPPPPGTYVSVSGSNVPSRLLYTQPGTRYLQRDV